MTIFLILVAVIVLYVWSGRLLPSPADIGKPVLEIPNELKTILEKSKERYYKANNSVNKYYQPKIPTFPIKEKTIIPPIDRLIYLESPIRHFDDLPAGSKRGNSSQITVEEITALHVPASLDELLLGQLILSVKKQKQVQPPPLPTLPLQNKLHPEDDEIPEAKLNLPSLQFKGLKGVLFNGYFKWLSESKYNEEIERFRDIRSERWRLIEKHESWNKELRKDNEEAMEKYSRAKDDYEKNLKAFQQQYEIDNETQAECDQQNKLLESIRSEYSTFSKEGVEGYFDLLLKRIPFPCAVPKEWKLSYSTDNKILIVDYRFPYLPLLEILKFVELKTKSEWKSINKTERRTLSSKIHPALSIRIAFEIARLDYLNAIGAVVINGWLRYPDQATGNIKEAYCSSLMCKKEDLLTLNLESLDPVKSFQAFKGRSSGEAFDVVPVAPIISMDTQDKRFVDPKEVLSQLQQGNNIATMPWEDFEHLVRQLFEKLYSIHGAEVKITQASRDLGVDAVIFDPTPIKGGKTVVQAKRYVNVVDVSAVRDLFGTVHNEGANKGILVTTSYFGPESYDFAKDKPLELINGQQLLGLLEQYGYNFRINLEEARVLNNQARFT